MPMTNPIAFYYKDEHEEPERIYARDLAEFQRSRSAAERDERRLEGNVTVGRFRRELDAANA